MLLKLLNNLLICLTLLCSVLFMTSANACDNKECETAYLAETQRHIENQIRRANTYKAERHAHSMNRERRAYAEFVHKYFIWASKQVSDL